MAAAQTVTAAQLITRIRYDLRDANAHQWSDSELLSYINDTLELIYEILVDCDSELIRTGSGTFDTVSGTEAYDLASNTMGDFWSPYRIWCPTAGPKELTQVNTDERYEYQIDATTWNQGEPWFYYLEGDNIGILPIPDGIYQINLKYYPNFVPLATTAANMPLRNLFNLQVMEAVKMKAKNRDMVNTGIETALMSLFQERAAAIMRKRGKREYQMMPRFK
jgi:hypothetical protein